MSTDLIRFFRDGSSQKFEFVATNQGYNRGGNCHSVFPYLISSEEEVEFPWLGVHGQPADEEGANLQ